MILLAISVISGIIFLYGIDKLINWVTKDFTEDDWKMIAEKPHHIINSKYPWDL
jgi:hypothetical protein